MIKNVQFMNSAYMLPYSNQELGSANHMLPLGEAFPYMVPAGYWLAVKEATIQSKVSTVTSYFVVHGLFSLPTKKGAYSFRVPLIIPPGLLLSATIVNNSQYTQWMIASMQGLLIPKTTDDYRDVWTKIQSAGT